MTLVTLIFSSLKQMMCGTDTSGPSSTSERPDMTTRGALRRRPMSQVAQSHITGGTTASSPSGELEPTGHAEGRPHRLCPPA
jgi:hypothetical protein